MIKYTRYLIICFACSFLNLGFADSFENKILLKVNNQIITSLDILNELEYLQIINEEFSNRKNELHYTLVYSPEGNTKYDDIFDGSYK